MAVLLVVLLADRPLARAQWQRRLSRPTARRPHFAGRRHGCSRWAEPLGTVTPWHCVERTSARSSWSTIVRSIAPGSRPSGTSLIPSSVATSKSHCGASIRRSLLRCSPAKSSWRRPPSPTSSASSRRRGAPPLDRAGVALNTSGSDEARTPRRGPDDRCQLVEPSIGSERPVDGDRKCLDPPIHRLHPEPTKGTGASLTDRADLTPIKGHRGDATELAHQGTRRDTERRSAASTHVEDPSEECGGDADRGRNRSSSQRREGDHPHQGAQHRHHHGLGERPRVQVSDIRHSSRVNHQPSCSTLAAVC